MYKADDRRFFSMNRSFRFFFSPRAVVFFILTLAVMTAIFLFSCEDSGDSSETSGTIVEIVLDICYDDFDELPAAEQQETYDSISHIIRKTAHFSAFAALGFCVSMFLGKCSVFCGKRFGAVIFCFLYACSDEFHQFFVPGRACMFTDVIIDTSGSVTGMIFSMIIFLIISKTAKSATTIHSGTPGA